MIPPPEDERRDEVKDLVSVEADQKQQNCTGDTNSGSSNLQNRLEPLKPTSSNDKESKQPIARKRWFDAFDHVCRKLNEVNVLLVHCSKCDLFF